MSAYTKVTIVCDWPGCQARIETQRSKTTDGRAEAKKHGWAHIGGIDLCGGKEQADRYDLTNSRWLRSHATRTDHLPIVKSSRKGFVLLSCSCDWVRPRPHSWGTEGEVPRTLANHHWRGHVEDVLKAAEGEGLQS